MAAATLTAHEAATAAGVTADTVRAWARMGAVKAVRVARRWAIDAASLLRRIALGREVSAARAARPAKPRITVEKLIALGGRRWQKNGMDRVYFNDWAELAGIEVDRYGTGNISAATWQGEGVSNSQGYKLLGSIEKFWFDVPTGEFEARYGCVESRVASQYAVFAAAVNGIRTRIAAL